MVFKILEVSDCDLKKKIHQDLRTSYYFCIVHLMQRSMENAVNAGTSIFFSSYMLMYIHARILYLDTVKKIRKK